MELLVLPGRRDININGMKITRYDVAISEEDSVDTN